MIEITRDIFNVKDDVHKGHALVDYILDVAGQKGTGKWTVIASLDLGLPLTLIGEAVFARCLSAQKEERMEASKLLPGPKPSAYKGDKKKFIDAIQSALLAAKIVSYTQGYVLMR